jgi:hypothetical protein
MSYISSSIMRRRDFVLACAGLALLPAAQANPRLDTLTSGLQRWGSGEFRRWGFLVYEATLWAKTDDPLKPPLALGLTYKRNLDGVKIADASVTEIRNLKIADESQLKVWGERMAQIFPDVKPEDRIVGVHLPEGARFFHNDRFIGSVDDPAFARAFFAIWLDARTSAPELRTLLLKRPA